MQNHKSSNKHGPIRGIKRPNFMQKHNYCCCANQAIFSLSLSLSTSIKVITDVNNSLAFKFFSRKSRTISILLGKQKMGSHELIHGSQTSQTQDQIIGLDSSPRPSKSVKSFRNPVQYVLRSQRLIFLFIGIAISSLIFSKLPVRQHQIANPAPLTTSETTHLSRRRVLYEAAEVQHVNAGGKVPLGLQRKSLRILVTGGAGFVGSHLVDRLMDRGDSVIVVDNYFTGKKDNLIHHFGNPRFELIRHDVVEPILLEVDQIYHLACPASPVHYKFNPVKTIKTNVVGTLNMLGLAKRVGARFLLTSTSEVYGDPLQHPQAETYWGNVNPIGVRSCYDEGKRTAETLTMDYHRGLGIEARIARIFNTYGPRMCIDDGRVVSNFVAQALRKEPLTVYGDGKQTRSFQFVSDLVEGLIRLMEGDHVGPFNLGNPGEFTMLELAEVVQEIIDRNARIEFRPNTEDDPHKRKPDITKAKQLLGWEPRVTLRKGLPLMVADFRHRIFGDQKEAAAAGGGGDATSSSMYSAN